MRHRAENSNKNKSFCKQIIFVNKSFCSENKHKEFIQIFFRNEFYKVVLIFFVNTWKFILKQLVVSGSVITSLCSLRLRLSEYKLVITSPSATNC